MNNLEIFNNEEFGCVRTTVINGEPFFVGKDIADILGYKDTSDAIKRHVDDEDKLTRCFTDSGQSREMYIINESGLYSLIISSKLPAAKRFKRWITSEVIPSIRKNGGYMLNQENMTPEQLVANALIVAQNIIADKDKQIERMKPKEIFADAVSASDGSILVGNLAKMLKQNGVEIGQNRMFQWLRDNGYVHKGGLDKNLPTQKSMELGVMEKKERNVINPDGSVRITFTPMITGKGQQYFINKFLGGDQLEVV